VGTWHDPDLGRPIATQLEWCTELLGVDLATLRELAAKVEPYIRADGTRIWSLMQLERQLRPEAYGHRRGGYIDRRRTSAADMPATFDDLRDHNPNRPPASSQLLEPEGRRPAVPLNRW
jgi:hypothetical protein